MFWGQWVGLATWTADDGQMLVDSQMLVVENAFEASPVFSTSVSYLAPERLCCLMIDCPFAF